MSVKSRASERERERERRASERRVFRQSESGSGSDKNSIALRSHYQSHNITPKKIFEVFTAEESRIFVLCRVGAWVLNLRPANGFSFSRFMFLLLYAQAWAA